MSIRPLSLLVTLATASFGVALSARASSITTTVLGTASVYNAGDGSTPATSVTIAPGVTSITFSAVSGTVSVNGGGNTNDADGIGSASPETNTGLGSLSGIMSPTAGYIAGVFEGPLGPIGPAPATLNFTAGGVGTAFTSLSAQLDQVFYIGDGLTGDKTGSTQTFYVPAGATSLYLGLADACGYYGGPSCFGDNSGSFSLTINEAGPAVPPVVGATPEPSSLVLLGTGVLGVAGAIRRRIRR